MNNSIVKVTFPPLADLNRKAQSLAKEGKKIINLGQAVPGFAPPKEAVDYIAGILDNPILNTYSPDPGLSEFRESLAAKLIEDNKITASPDEIVVTAGANSAFLMTMLTLLNAGDEVILLGPYYFNHAMTVEMLGASIVEVPLGKENFSLNKTILEKSFSKRTKCIVVVSPANPTGSVLSKEDIEWIYDTALKHNTYVITDETYEYFHFDNIPHFSLRSCWRQNVISLFSFSKSFAMAGYRIGFVSADRDFIDEFLKAQDNNIICAPVISQMLAQKALECRKTYIPQIRDMLQSRRDTLRNAFENTNVKFLPCSGAFFAMIEIPDTHGFEFSSKLLNEHGVVIVPGEVFGKSGTGMFRVAFGASDNEELKKAAELICSAART